MDHGDGGRGHGDRAARPVTVVTGASRGIGAAIAIRLARAGHDLALCYRSDRDAVDQVARWVTAEGAHCLPVQADVADPEAVERLFTVAGSRLGPVTGLVNNAGLTAHLADLADTPVETVKLVLDVNLYGAVLCARQAARVMSTRRGGRGGVIVNISSAAATLGGAHDYVHYAAAKAGIDALTHGLAVELGADGIRVNAVSPGLIHTDIHAAAGDAGRADRLAAARVPMGRAGEPDEIAPAVAWLFGPEAGYVNGAVLRISGGL